MTDVDCQKLGNCTSIPSTANSYSESNHILVIVFRCFMIFNKISDGRSPQSIKGICF
jgi:hypothetical protein